MKIYLVRESIGAPEDNWPVCVTDNRNLALRRLAEIAAHVDESWINVYDSETGEELSHDPDNFKKLANE